MQSVNKELKNIPISISVLHEQEYNNLLHKLNKNKRRSCSDKSKHNIVQTQNKSSKN